jgi:hypothetical protein
MDLLAGRIISQEIVSASHGASMRPNIGVDPEGDLHLVWIDTAGFSRYRVVYASTASLVKETLNRTTIYEVTDMIFGSVMSMVSSLIFAPVVLAWALIPIGWLVGFAVVTGRTEISEPYARLALGVAMLLHLVAKLLFSSGLLAQFPLGAGLPPWVSSVLGRWVGPLLLAGVSAGLAWLYLRRGRSQSMFVAYLVYLAVDSLLTLAVYIAPLMA